MDVGDAATDLSVHGGHGFGDSLHGLSHTVVGLERLYLQADGLNVGFHQDELLDVASRANQILGHDLDGVLQTLKQAASTSGFFLVFFRNCSFVSPPYHLSLFGHFLDVSDDLLLLLLQFHSLSVQFSHGSIERPLILLQQLLWSLPPPKQGIHLFKNTHGGQTKEKNAKKNPTNF